MIAALRKEFLLQWRTRAQAVAVFVFGATSLLLFSFAIGPNAEALREHGAEVRTRCMDWRTSWSTAPA